jgi:hypothetical protein
MMGLIPAVVALFISGAANAQWAEFVDRADHFTVNFPGDPAKSDLSYKTAKGTTLPAHVYAAQDQRGRYTMTVVNYANAPDELASAIDDAAAAVRAKGAVKYDGTGMLDNHKSQRITVETPAQRRPARGNSRVYGQAPLHFRGRDGAQRSAAGPVPGLAAGARR